MKKPVAKTIEAEVMAVRAIYDTNIDEVVISAKWTEEADWDELKLRLPAGSVACRDTIIIEIHREPEA